jgi:hypothetical protein
VGCTIDLDDQPFFPTKEIDNIGTDRDLSDELEILQSAAA